MTEPSVFQYLDYRPFLNDLFGYHKQKNSFFSHRYFARRAGFAAPNFLKLVITGQRNLTNTSIAQVAKGFSLKNKEREFFEYLVFMSQATKHEERNYYYQKMMAIRGVGSIRKLESASYEYFSTWYIPVIREVATWGNGRMGAEEIAALLNPPIAPKDAERGLKVLTELQLLERDAAGKWQHRDAAVTTGPEVRSLVIANYHREMIRLASDSIERHPAQERDISALTLSVSRVRLPELKKRIADFRRELLDLACREEDPQQVMQINFQAFPLTQPAAQKAVKPMGKTKKQQGRCT